MSSGGQPGPCYRRFQPLLHKYILKNDYDAIRYILSSHQRDCINDMDHDGRNAFHLALHTANSKALYLLLYYPFIHTSQVFATLDWTSNSDDDIDKDFVQVGNSTPAYQAGDRLLIKWNENPELYKRAAFATLEGYSIRGCGSSIVEDIYEQHYNYILGNPHTLERSAREYTAKYARMYSKEINYTDKMETIYELKEKNCIPSNIVSSELIMDSEDSKNISFASDFISSSDNSELQIIPLEVVDLLIPFDMTSPIHLLFSNIYIESYRSKIMDCLKILIAYFRVFDQKESTDSVKRMHINNNMEEIDCSASLLEMILRKNYFLKPIITWSEFIFYRDHTLSTVLHRACQVRSGEIVSTLLRCGLCPLAINENGDLPIHLAVDSLDPDLFKTILDATIVAIYTKYEDSSEEMCNNIIDNQNIPKFDKRVLSAIGNIQVLLKLFDGLLTYTSKFVGDGATNIDSIMSKSMQDGQLLKNKFILYEDKLVLKQLPGEVIFDRLFSKYGDVFINTISILLSELLLFFEQLICRCIHRNSWRIFLTLASFNATLTFHIFSNPLMIHRLIKFAHSVGNVYAFFSILNYSVGLLYPNEVKDDEKALAEPTCTNNLFNRKHVKIESGGDSGINRKAVEDLRQIMYDYRGCGYPETPLRRVRIPNKPFIKFEQLKLSNFEGCNINQLLSNVSINKRTWIITHPICLEHLAIPEPTDMPQRRNKLVSTFAENPTRLEVIISNDNAILRTDLLDGVYILQSPPPACLADILRVHDIGYINKLLQQYICF